MKAAIEKREKRSIEEPEGADEIVERLSGMKAMIDARESKEQKPIEHRVELTARDRFNRGGFPKRLAEHKIDDLEGVEYNRAFRKVNAKLGDAGVMIAIVGERRKGKTLFATCLAKKQANDRRSVLYTSAMEFFLTLQSTYSKPDRSELEALNDFYRPDFLVIDELQERSESKWEDQKLTLLLDKRYRDGKDTVIIANLKESALAENLGESATRRLRDTGGILVANWEVPK